MLEVYEEVAHVGHLLWLFLISDDIECRVATLMSDVDLIFQLPLRVATRDVFNAQISPQVQTLLHKVDLDRLIVGVPVRLGCLAAILRACRTLRVVARFLVGIWRVRIVEMVGELRVAIVVATVVVESHVSRPLNLLRACRLQVVTAETSSIGGVIQRSNHNRRSIESLHVRVLAVA